MGENEIKLEPCPFCGSEVSEFNISWGTAGVVSCKKCKTKFVIPWNESETPNDLYNAWNRRAKNGI